MTGIMDNQDQLPPPPYSAHDPNGIASAPSANSNPILTFPNDKKASKAKDEGPFFVSGAAYFAMHSFYAPRELPLLTYHIPLSQDGTPKSTHFPGTRNAIWDRDLSAQDWLAFLNHLNLQQPDVRGAAGPSRTLERDGNAVEKEEREISLLHAVTHEWNEGFFGPRGLVIKLDINSTPKYGARVPENDRRQPSGTEVTEQASSNESVGLALYHAVTKGNAKLVQTLLDSGASAKFRPLCAKPALTRAVENGDWHIVQMILERGQPDLEATAPAGETALYVAISKGCPKLVHYLLRHGADVRAKPPGGEPALYKAISKNFTEIVQMLCESDDIDVDATPPGGRPSIYLAFEKGVVKVMDLLLKKGAKPDAKPSGGSTTMYKAAGHGDLEITRMLLEYGADPDATPPGGNTALYNAASKGKEAVARVLIGYGAKINKTASGHNSALWIAADNGDMTLARLLLEHGALVDATTCGGNTALWRAAKRGDLQIAGLLLEHGANPDEKIMGNDTALMYAANKGNVHVARLLMRYGADPHKKIGSETALSRASKKGHLPFVEAIISSTAVARGLVSGESSKT